MNNHLKKIWDSFYSRGSIIAFLLLFTVASIVFMDKNLASFPSIMLLLRKASSDVGIVALGMTFVILVGQIDLSVGSVMAFAGVIMAMFGQQNQLLGIMVALAGGLLCGLINGLIVTKMKIPSWITTLAMLLGLRGFVLLISDKKPIPVKGDLLKALANSRIPLFGKESIPVLVIIFFLLVFLCMHLSKNTKLGTSLFAIGGNEEAARMMGLPVDRIKIFAFMACSFFAALGGILIASKLGTAQPNAGDAWETTAIAMCALGGVKLSGGEGRFSGTFFGVLIITIINTMFNYSGRLSTSWQQVVMGGIILLSIALQSELILSFREQFRLRRQKG